METGVYYGAMNFRKSMHFSIGIFKKAWLTLEDKRYYLNEDGIRQDSGWFAITGTNSNGQEYANWYYAESDGNIARGGFKQMEGN